MSTEKERERPDRDRRFGEFFIPEAPSTYIYGQDLREDPSGLRGWRRRVWDPVSVEGETGKGRGSETT